jgi:DNA-directed RNA polymerase subunit RPC12/RpoP
MPHLHCIVCERRLYSAGRLDDLRDPRCSDCGSRLEVDGHPVADGVDVARFVRAGRLLGDPQPASR